MIPRIGGQVIEVSTKLNEGYLVDADEILIRIDDEDYRLNLRRAEADILAAKASMTNALAQVASAQAQASQAEARLAAEEAEANAAREEWRLLKKDGDPPALLLRELRFTRLGRRLLRPVPLRNPLQRELNLARPRCLRPWRLRSERSWIWSGALFEPHLMPA